MSHPRRNPFTRAAGITWARTFLFLLPSRCWAGAATRLVPVIQQCLSTVMRILYAKDGQEKGTVSVMVLSRNP